MVCRAHKTVPDSPGERPTFSPPLVENPPVTANGIGGIKNNAWVTVNNNFLVTSGVICQWFSRVTKSLANHWQITSRVTKKIVIHGNECIIFFLTGYFISWTQRSATNYHRSLISQLSLGMVFSDLTLWRHHSWSVTSREREALALWRHIRQLSLHAQIGTKAIFTSE